MAKFKIYGNRTAEETALEKENRKLAGKVACEGFVLLKNDGVLPLKNKKVALYGAGARLTVKGGSGSGDVRERYSVNIEQGLKNNGFEIVGTSWLERFSQTYENDKKKYEEEVENAIKGYPVWKVMDMFKKISEFKLAYPVGDEIKSEDLTGETDTAIYVIARQAGEGDDRKLEKGDYLLSDLEVTNLKICKNHYKNLVVVINCGGTLDISPISDDVNAILYYGQAGEEGGNALGEILCGKVSPSGRLTDTWGKTYDDYPTARILHPEVLEENYEEGIYVGYRYFDAKSITPLYPFGYGLSYTIFESAVQSVSVIDGLVTLTVSVKNVGDFDGKEVVQVYLSKPNVKYFGEVKSLVAFEKTHTLKSKESQILEISFNLADSAVYDEESASFVLESGLYEVYIGKNAMEVTAVCALKVLKDVVTEKCKNLCKKQKNFEDYKIKTPKANYDGLPVYEIGSITSKTNDYGYDLPKALPAVQKYIDALTDNELATFCMGGGYFTKQYINVLGSCGNTTSKLLKKGIPNIIMSDGPAGINIMPKSAYSRRGGTKYVDQLPKEWQWGWLKKVVPKLSFLYAKPKHVHCYQYCTAWPNATTLAQTFNTELVERVGEAVGKEMLVMGITLWLAPALNIHRDPLCGRNFEYYSEDPFVSGRFASAITKGVQSNEGVGVTIKHFACNNRENNRMEVSSNLSERTLREIYLKGFRMACKFKPMAIMSSYNRLNGTYTADNKELLIDILRCEWGYSGLVMSDWDGTDHSDYASTVKNGNNMIMPGRKDIYKKICKAIKEAKLTRKDLTYSATYALNMIFTAKTTKDFIDGGK